MLFQRDPLSVEYDAAAREAISRAIARARRAGRNSRIPRWVDVVVTSPPLAPREGGLSRDERAFQRAMYHDQRVHKPRRDTGDWSLDVDWQPAGLTRRTARIRVFREASGKAHIAAGPKRLSYIENPELRSGWGTPHQRFA